MGSQDLWYYRDQIYRIVLESLEVSFMVCKAELEEYTIAKIFDVFMQILPTGFVLQTGFWPFFNNNKKQSVCVCGRFGINCRHSKHGCHWLDLESICNDTSMIFSCHIGDLVILNYRVDIIPQIAGNLGYLISINLTMQYKINRSQASRKKRNIIISSTKFDPNRPFNVCINCRYNLQREYFANTRTMVFQPSPFYHEIYGTIFHDLLRAREPYVSFLPDRSNSFYTVTADSMPHFTLLLQEVNLPVYHCSEYLQVSLTLLHQDVPTTNFARAPQTSLVPRQPTYPVHSSYHPFFTNNIGHNPSKPNNNLLALEYNVNPAQTQTRKKNKKNDVLELPVETSSTSQAMQPSTSSFDAGAAKLDLNQMDTDLFWHTLGKMYLRPLEEQIKKEIERDFLNNQQFTDKKFSNN